MYERFTDRARKVMQLANQEAQRFNHDCIGTEHVLLALVKEGSGIVANVLKNLDIDLRRIRLETEKLLVRPRGDMSLSKLPLIPNVVKLIEHAKQEASHLKHNYVGTEHLLLGCLRMPDGVACKVLNALGVDVSQVRDAVMELLTPEPQDVAEQIKHVIQMCEAQMRHLKACFDAAIAQIKEAGEREVARLKMEHLQRMSDRNAQLPEPAVNDVLTTMNGMSDGHIVYQGEVGKCQFQHLGVSVEERIFDLGEGKRKLAWCRGEMVKLHIAEGMLSPLFHVAYTDGNDWAARDKVMAAFNEHWQLKDVTEEQKNKQWPLLSQRQFSVGNLLVEERVYQMSEDTRRLLWCRVPYNQLIDGKENPLFFIDFKGEDERPARDEIMAAFNRCWKQMRSEKMTDPDEAIIDVDSLPAEDRHAVHEYMKQTGVSLWLTCERCADCHADGELILDGKKVCGTCFNSETMQEQSWRDRPSML